jgi:hypothetical protein
MNDNVLKRLRWTMVGVIALDAANTLLGQPRTYWTNPSTTNEHTPFVRFFAQLGGLPFILYWVVYTVAASLFVSKLPKRFAPIGIFTFILPHYFGATTWWVYEWGYGQKAATIYGFSLAVILGLAFLSRATSSDPQ